MGADLISFICVGPTTLDSRKKQKAMRQVSMLLAKEEFIPDGYDSHQDFLDNLPHLYAGDPDLFATKIVWELFEVWHKGSRDSSSRPVNLLRDPSKKTKEKNPKKIVVAGEMSWGDEPDGFGYQTLKWADIFGLFEIFDIR